MLVSTFVANDGHGGHDGRDVSITACVDNKHDASMMLYFAYICLRAIDCQLFALIQRRHIVI